MINKLVEILTRGKRVNKMGIAASWVLFTKHIRSENKKSKQHPSFMRVSVGMNAKSPLRSPFNL